MQGLDLLLALDGRLQEVGRDLVGIVLVVGLDDRHVQRLEGPSLEDLLVLFLLLLRRIVVVDPDVLQLLLLELLRAVEEELADHSSVEPT